jgi:predicted RecB family nuclease
VLNEHCPLCEFRERCRAAATKEDTRYSFWADQKGDQASMFFALLDQLNHYPEYRLFHFGSYETRAWKQAKAEFPDYRQQQVEQVLNRSVNVLALLYARVYVPTYSNSLKEIARLLGQRRLDRKLHLYVRSSEPLAD